MSTLSTLNAHGLYPTAGGNFRIAGSISARNLPQLLGAVWYVDTTSTAALPTGKSWASAFTTIAEAIAAAENYDTIYVSGAVTETIVSPTHLVGPNWLTIEGVGGTPLFPATTWQAATATGVPLTLKAYGWSIKNIRFLGVGASAELILLRASGTTLAFDVSNPAYSSIVNCTFSGGGATMALSAIAFSPDYVAGPVISPIIDILIEGCYFYNFALGDSSGLCIIDVNDATGDSPTLRCVFKNNIFTYCDGYIDLQQNGASSCIFIGNLFNYPVDTKSVLKLGAGGAGGNVVTGNVFAGVNAGAGEYDQSHELADTGDFWNGNIVDATNGTGFTGSAAVPGAA